MAMILDAFVRSYVDKLSEFAEGQMCMALGVKKELKTLKRRLERTGDFLEPAERKRHGDQNIDSWVRELKDVMYDADDIIDRCVIEGRRSLEDHPSDPAVRHRSSLFSRFGSSKTRHEIGSEITRLNDRLKLIEKNRPKLPPLENTRKKAQESGVNSRQTFPSAVKPGIVGKQIEEATRSLVESLIKDQDNKKCRILGIVGKGGIGKTTLASKIYEDERIKENFIIRAWINVSEECSGIKLLKDVMRSLGARFWDHGTEAEIASRIASSLSSLLSERFLIILDGISSAELWNDVLRVPLENAKANGRIVITTRDEGVAENMGAEIHPVDKMDNDSGWELLRKNVFGDDDGEEGQISSLREIGVKIVKKCDGLPLAIKAVAGVLRFKERSTMGWNKVLESHDARTMSRLPEELPAALFVCYEDLPSALKQCFLYCSLFPEDFKMHRRDLIRFWVAEGFVKTTQGDTIMEDLAEDYYRELIWRNLLHGRDDDDAWFTMHDVLRSLALFLVRDESTVVGDEESVNENTLTKLRRLSMVDVEERVEVPEAVKRQQCLRTLLTWSNKAKIVEKELFGSSRLLRVVGLSDSGLERLPYFIGNLLHLRYLDLDRTEISNLPDDIGCLVNLQILYLSGCESLHTLPETITKLCNLRFLHLEETPLTHVPKGIGRLKHLNHLGGFVIGHDDRNGTEDDEGCDLEELQSLSQLRFLSITKLERARAGEAPVLADISFLRTLILNCERFDDAEEAKRIDEIYNQLSPRPAHLQRLEINYFFGTGFPSWMISPSLDVTFPNLTRVTLRGCRSCPELPPLGLLPQLKYLHISQALAVKTIGPEFFGARASSAVTSFPKLEELKLERMNNWTEWSFGTMEGVGEERRGAPKLLPRLDKLRLAFCPKLKALPEGLRHATNLHELSISYADDLTEINNLPSLTDHLEIVTSRSLERLSNLPSLKSLRISDCPSLKHTKSLDELQLLFVAVSSSIRTSTTDADGQTERLPQWLVELLGQHPLQNLRQFHLTCSVPLLRTFLKDGPNWPIIQWIPRVWMQSFAGVSHIKYTKNPPTFETNLLEPEEFYG